MNKRILIAVALVGMMLASPIAGAVPTSEVSYEGDNAAPNPQFDVDSLTVARHPVSNGLSDEAMTGYYNDNGEWVSDTVFQVNTSSDISSGTNVNPYTFNPAHIEEGSYGLFPRVDGASALNASEWSKSGSNSSGLSLSDTSVAEGVDAVRINTGTSFASGNTATATYSNWTDQLDSDESKRVLQLGGDIDTLESGATVYVNVTDETGDEKSFTISPSVNQSDSASTVVGQTGSFVYQKKLSKVSTTGGGGFDNIESIDIHVADGDVDLSLSWVDLAHKGTEAIVDQKYDGSDDDTDYDDTRTVYSTVGSVSTHSMKTLGDKFSDAVLNDVSFPAIADAASLNGEEGPKGAYQISWDGAADYPSFDQTLNTSYRMKLPAQIDLSYSGVNLTVEQNFPEGRYTTAGYAEGVSDSTAFGGASLNSFTGSLGADGSEVTIDSTVSTGTSYVVTFNVLTTAEEKKAIEDVNTGGAAAPPQSSNSGGFWGFLTSLPGMILAGVTGFFGIRLFKSGN